MEKANRIKNGYTAASEVKKVLAAEHNISNGDAQTLNQLIDERISLGKSYLYYTVKNELEVEGLLKELRELGYKADVTSDNKKRILINFPDGDESKDETGDGTKPGPIEGEIINGTSTESGNSEKI